MSLAGHDRGELDGVEPHLGHLLGQLVVLKRVMDEGIDVGRVEAAAGRLADVADDVALCQVHQVLGMAEKTFFIKPETQGR